MTLAHPSVPSFESARRGLVRAPARTGRPAPEDPQRDARIAARTRMGLGAASTLIRAAVAVTLVAVAYLVVTQGVSAMTETAVGWYNGLVAPYLAVDFSVYQPLEPSGVFYGPMRPPPAEIMSAS